MSDHRLSPRQRSLLRGVVYFAGNPCAANCLVRDLSETGARIEFTAPPVAVTNNLELQIPLKAQRHHCRVVWRSGREIGVAFAEASITVGPQDVAERMDRLEAEIAGLKATIRRLQRDEGPETEVA
jgi:hypothetical protein